MDILRPFTIPVKGLQNGKRRFNFQVDRSFFQAFEGSPIEEGTFEVNMDLEKRHDMLELHFDFAGKVKTECDRCLAPIHLPVADKQSLLVKFSPVERLEEADVVYISPDAGELNVAKYVYEFICLAMPYIHRYDCLDDSPPPCDFEALKRIQNEEGKADNETGTIWDHLKDQYKES